MNDAIMSQTKRHSIAVRYAALAGLAAMAALLLGVTTVDAQKRYEDEWEDPVAHLNIAFLVAQPVGEFEQFIDDGFGAELAGRFPLDDKGVLSLRVEAGFITYGLERQRVCFSSTVGCRVQLDLTTTNNIFFGGFGPELAMPGKWARPYATATFGFGYFNTHSSVSGADDFDEFAGTENFGDGTFAWRAGGGIEFQVSHGRTPVAIDLGWRYHNNGVNEFLRKGDIIDNPDGSITIFPNRSETNIVTFQMGVSIGLRHGDDDDDWNGHRGR